MAKRKADNFIASDDEDNGDFDETGQSAQSEQDEKPKSRKKSRTTVKNESNDDEVENSLKMKPKSAKEPKIESESPDGADIAIHSTTEGDKYLDLGKKKRATVRTFKGNMLLDIREFYGTDGDEKPGKKGISLSIEQWQALKHSASAIDSLFADLKKKK